jgi:molecular chaperone DnaJ
MLEFRRLETCGACRGTGGDKGAEPDVCSGCNGRGQVRYQQGFSPSPAPARSAAAPGGW